MGSERQNEINKWVSQSDPEYWWQETQSCATLHFSLVSSCFESLLYPFVHIVSQGTCSVLYSNVLKYSFIDMREGGASVCPPIMQTCTSLPEEHPDFWTCSLEKEIDFFISEEQMGWWVATSLAACRLWSYPCLFQLQASGEGKKKCILYLLITVIVHLCFGTSWCENIL